MVMLIHIQVGSKVAPSIRVCFRLQIITPVTMIHGCLLCMYRVARVLTFLASIFGFKAPVVGTVP